MLIISDTVKKYLLLSDSLPDDWFLKMCSFAESFLEHGPSLKTYSAAAGKLEMDAASVQKIIESITILFVESCKQKVSVGTLLDWCKELGLKDGRGQLLSSFYVAQQNGIAQSLRAASLTVPVYHNLEWRFDCHVGSRAVPEHTEAVVAIKLSLESAGTRENTLLEAGPADFLHLAQELERALAASSAPHARRVQRRFSSRHIEKTDHTESVDVP